MTWARYRNRSFSAVLLACVTLGTLVQGERTEAKTPTIAVSIAPQAWLVRQLAGDDARVITLVPPGRSPHSYQPTDSQVSDVMRGDLYIRAGIPFEHGRWFTAIVASKKLVVVDMRAGITLREINGHAHADHETGHGPSAKDPHIWLDPALLKRQAQTITRALQQLNPNHSADYAERLAELSDRLTQLDGSIRRALAPYRDRPLFVFHPAWGYFCDAYALRQLPVEVEGKEPTDFELTELHRLARQEGIKVVFVQPQITSRSAAAIAQAIHGRVVVADPLAEDVIKNLRSFTRAVVGSFD